MPVQSTPDLARLNDRLVDHARDIKPEGAEVRVVDAILDWLRTAQAEPLFLLLGDLGTGKTIACQRVVQELGRAGPYRPIYVDLRWVNLPKDRMPTLEEIVDPCLAGNTRPGEMAPRTAELLRRAEEEPILWVLDGLDEALVHLTENDSARFTQRLLRLCERTPTRVLLSCRTHFFRKPEEEPRLIRGVCATNYRALTLLPLNEAQIRDFLARSVREIDPDEAMRRLSSVHDLRGLCANPYVLRLVADDLVMIEALRRAGRPIGIALYRSVVESWLNRDSGKHQLLAEDKAALMTHLATWMWRSDATEFPMRGIEAQMYAWIETDPARRRRYRGYSADKLETDLRTSTFLVRKPGEAAAFRFAHPSLLEYFLALGLVEALAADHPEGWTIPEPSAATFDFVRQRLAEVADPRLWARLEAWTSTRRASMRLCALANVQRVLLHRPANLDLPPQEP